MLENDNFSCAFYICVLRTFFFLHLNHIQNNFLFSHVLALIFYSTFKIQFGKLLFNFKSLLVSACFSHATHGCACLLEHVAVLAFLNTWLHYAVQWG